MKEWWKRIRTTKIVFKKYRWEKKINKNRIWGPLLPFPPHRPLLLPLLLLIFLSLFPFLHLLQFSLFCYSSLSSFFSQYNRAPRNRAQQNRVTRSIYASIAPFQGSNIQEDMSGISHHPSNTCMDQDKGTIFLWAVLFYKVFFLGKLNIDF